MRNLTLILLALFQFAFAQTVDYDRVIPPEEAGNLSFEEKLVRLAWQNYPANRIVESKVRVADARLSQSKLGWLDPVTLQFNYGEQNINPNFNPAFFPRYNLAVFINLGQIFKVPAKIEESRAELEGRLQDVNLQKMQIRAEVLRRYFEYERRLELLKVHTQRYDDAYSSYLALTNKFQNGEVSLEEYNRSLIIFNDALEKKVESEGFIKIARANVEEMIGVRLDEVE